MKRYELTIADRTLKFYGNEHFIDRELQLLTIMDNGTVVCQAGIQGIILQIRNEEYLKKENEILADRARRIMERYEKQNETILDTIKKYFKK
jgi:hypothetical protein